MVESHRSEKGEARMQYTIREGVNPTSHIYTRAPTEEYAKTELGLLAEAELAKPAKATAIKALADMDPNFQKREFEKSYRESGRIKLFFNRLARVKNGEFPWKEDGWLDKAQGEEGKGEGEA